MPVYVKMVHNVSAVWGSDSACVADQPKQWIFDGNGLTPSGDKDLIKFVIDSTDCASDFDAPLTGADSDGVAMYLDTYGNATFILESEAAGHSVNLCYKFGNEEFMWYDIQAYVHMLKSVESRVGGKDTAVADIEEILLVHANGSSPEDFIRWVVSDDTSDNSCNDTITVWDTPGEGNGTTDIPVIARREEFLANFTFGSSSAGLSPTLCYKFSGEQVS